MTTPTKDRLAAELRKVADIAGPQNAAIYRALADRAETGEFDDYSDTHMCGQTALYSELMQHGLNKFAGRVESGEFDASIEESEAWARSQTDPQVIAMIEAMGIGPDRSKDQ